MPEPIEEDVKKIIRSKLKKKVTPGLDKVRVREILENEEIFVPIVTDLLKNSIQQAVVPDKMKLVFFDRYIRKVATEIWRIIVQ